MFGRNRRARKAQQDAETKTNEEWLDEARDLWGFFGENAEVSHVCDGMDAEFPVAERREPLRGEEGVGSGVSPIAITVNLPQGLDAEAAAQAVLREMRVAAKDADLALTVNQVDDADREAFRKAQEEAATFGRRHCDPPSPEEKDASHGHTAQRPVLDDADEGYTITAWVEGLYYDSAGRLSFKDSYSDGPVGRILVRSQIGGDAPIVDITHPPTPGHRVRQWEPAEEVTIMTTSGEILTISPEPDLVDARSLRVLPIHDIATFDAADVFERSDLPIWKAGFEAGFAHAGEFIDFEEVGDDTEPAMPLPADAAPGSLWVRGDDGKPVQVGSLALLDEAVEDDSPLLNQRAEGGGPESTTNWHNRGTNGPWVRRGLMLSAEHWSGVLTAHGKFVAVADSYTAGEEAQAAARLEYGPQVNTVDLIVATDEQLLQRIERLEGI